MSDSDGLMPEASPETGLQHSEVVRLRSRLAQEQQRTQEVVKMFTQVLGYNKLLLNDRNSCLEDNARLESYLDGHEEILAGYKDTLDSQKKFMADQMRIAAVVRKGYQFPSGRKQGAIDDLTAVLMMLAENYCEKYDSLPSNKQLLEELDHLCGHPVVQEVDWESRYVYWQKVDTGKAKRTTFNSINSRITKVRAILKMTFR